MDQKTKEIVERLRAIDEDVMYCFPASTYALASETASLITRLSERVDELERLLDDVLEAFDTIGLEPTNPNDGINHGRNAMMASRAIAKFLRTKQPPARNLLSKQEERG